MSFLRDHYDLITFPYPFIFPQGGDFLSDVTIDGNLDLTATATSRLLLPTNDDAANPTIQFVNSGIYEKSAGELAVSIGEVKQFFWVGAQYFAAGASGAGMMNESASATNPTSLAARNDLDTGRGSAGADIISDIAGGVEAMRYTENIGVLQTIQTNGGLTADSGSAQGGTPLTSSRNVITVVVTIDDSVTLPPAKVGDLCVVINEAANALAVFPGSGDDLGAGVNLESQLAGGANITYFAISASKWIIIT